jgi:hypothetical protein
MRIHSGQAAFLAEKVAGAIIKVSNETFLKSSLTLCRYAGCWRLPRSFSIVEKQRLGKSK